MVGRQTASYGRFNRDAPVTGENNMPDANDYFAAAARFDELAARLIHDANELARADPSLLGGLGPRFNDAAADLREASARLKTGGRALTAVASTCRDRAIECDAHPTTVGVVSTNQGSRSW